MGKERNKRVEIGLPEYLLSHAKVTAKMRGLKLNQLIREALEKHLLGSEFRVQSSGLLTSAEPLNREPLIFYSTPQAEPSDFPGPSTIPEGEEERAWAGLVREKDRMGATYPGKAFDVSDLHTS